MGDIPIFVAADSCDTWVNPQWYYLEPSGRPAKVAGVPPDYFSKTGPVSYTHLDVYKRQVLPLNPIGYGESPYQAYSAFAGNFYLISPLELEKRGLLEKSELAEFPCLSEHKVDYSIVKFAKFKLFRLAYKRFRQQAYPVEYLKFLQKNKYWLSDYALYMAIKTSLGGLPWSQWPKDIATRQPEALLSYGLKLQEEIEFHHFLQYVFYSQWQSL